MHHRLAYFLETTQAGRYRGMTHISGEAHGEEQKVDY